MPVVPGTQAAITSAEEALPTSRALWGCLSCSRQPMAAAGAACGSSKQVSPWGAHYLRKGHCSDTEAAPGGHRDSSSVMAVHLARDQRCICMFSCPLATQCRVEDSLDNALPWALLDQ